MRVRMTKVKHSKRFKSDMQETQRRWSHRDNRGHGGRSTCREGESEQTA